MNTAVRPFEFISALESEARTLAGTGMPVTVCGVGAKRAAAATEWIMRRRPTAVVSWGVAGGLDPALAAGTLIRPAEVVDDQGNVWPTATPDAQGRLLTTGELITRPEHKRSAWQASCADAVDMESAAIARVCSEHEVPLLVVRAISDPAARRLPDQAGQMVDDHGRARIGTALVSILRRPAEVPALWLCAMDFHRALRALRSAAAELSTMTSAAA